MNSKILKELTTQCALSLSPAEQERMIHDLASILAFVDQIHTVPTDGIEPLVHPHNMGSMRGLDEPESTQHYMIYQTEEIETAEHFYIVPKVIEP